MGNLTTIYRDEIESHLKWLRDFNQKRTYKWRALFKANPEAAICEACVRHILAEYIDIIEPNEDISNGGPDFLCKQGDEWFFVEVTCISIDSATKKTGLNHPPMSTEVTDHEDLTDKIFGELRNKTPQCKNLQHPCILAIGTLHFDAGLICMDEYSMEEVLTGSSLITAEINPENGSIIGESYEEAYLSNSSFIRPSKSSESLIEDARKTISAILLCSFGQKPLRMIGALHPNPNHVFSRQLLPEIKFAKLTERYKKGIFEVIWI